MATRAERIEAVCTALHAPFKKHLKKAHWGPSGCPYEIDEFNGRKRIRVTNPETGDTIAASGETMDEAVEKLEKRFKQYQKEGV